jgi:hypothetical protein
MSERSKVVNEVAFLTRIGFVFACQFLALYGVLGSLGKPDSPSYRDFKTNLLDPWTTWCPVNCYGTGWSHWGGPYSIFWYWSNTVLSLNGTVPLTLSYIAGNIFVQILLVRRKWFSVTFAFSALVTLLAYPQNMILTWLLFLGFYRKEGLILAPLFKLPIGDFSGRMWLFFLSSPTSVHEPDNWPVYVWLGFLWVLGVLSLRSKSRKVSVNVANQENDPGELDPHHKGKDIDKLGEGQAGINSPVEQDWDVEEVEDWRN